MMSETIQIELAVMSLGWNNPKGESFVPWLREVKLAGYAGISGFAGHGDWGWGWDMIDAPQHFRTVLDGEGLRLASVDLPLHLSNEDDCERICAFMAALNCDNLICLNKWRDKQYDEFADILNRRGEIAQRYGVRAFFHNNTGGMGETREEVEYVLSLVDRSLVHTMCDLGHATKDFVNQPVAQRAVSFVQAHAPDIAFLEFKDWHPDTDLNTPVGEGLCDYPAVFEWLKTRGYQGWIVVEQNGNQGLSKGRTPLECAQISRAYIRTGLGV